MAVIFVKTSKRQPDMIIRIVMLLSIVLAITISSSVLAFDSTEELQNALVGVQFGTNLQAVEGSCTKLLQQYTNSPVAIGEIYLSLALNNAYRVEGYSNIIEASQKALRFPLDVIDECRAYESLGDGLRMKMMSSGRAFSPRLNEREQTEMRKQILDVYLNALKLILSNAETLQKQEVPGVPMFDIASVVVLTNAAQTQEEREKIGALNRTNALWYQKQRQEWQTQLKAHDEIVAANDLVDQYNRFKREAVDLYRGIPFVDEITEEGEKIMPGAPVLKELVEEVKKSNAPPPTSETNSIR